LENLMDGEGFAAEELLLRPVARDRIPPCILTCPDSCPIDESAEEAEEAGGGTSGGTVRPASSSRKVGNGEVTSAQKLEAI